MRFRHALIVGKFAPPHLGHQCLIETAVSQALRVTVLCYAVPDFVANPSQRRAQWLRELYPTVDIHVPADAPRDDAGPQAQCQFVRAWLAQRGIEVDAVFTGESYGDGFARSLGLHVKHCLVDPSRVRNRASGTAIRADVHAAREFLDPRIYRHFVQRVVLLGAESTGKTTLTAALAHHYRTLYVSEVGREVWERKKGDLTVQDYVHIAERHRAEEDEAIPKAHRFLFVDTNALSTLLLGFCYRHLAIAPPQLLGWANECKERYALTFVCDDDIPFVQDGWRGDIAWRKHVQGMVLYDLAVRAISHHVLSGSLDARAGKARLVLEQQGLDLERRHGKRGSDSRRPEA